MKSNNIPVYNIKISALLPDKNYNDFIADIKKICHQVLLDNNIHSMQDSYVNLLCSELYDIASIYYYGTHDLNKIYAIQLDKVFTFFTTYISKDIRIIDEIIEKIICDIDCSNYDLTGPYAWWNPT